MKFSLLKFVKFYKEHDITLILYTCISKLTNSFSPLGKHVSYTVYSRHVIIL